MFKCTHCGEKFAKVVPRGKAHNFVSLEIEEDSVCPECNDGILRPYPEKEESPSVCS